MSETFIQRTYDEQSKGLRHLNRFLSHNVKRKEDVYQLNASVMGYQYHPDIKCWISKKQLKLLQK